MMQVINGHLVHYFSLWPYALSVMHRAYQHAYHTPLKEATPIGAELRRELCVLQGLVFVCGGVNLLTPPAGVAVCSDASKGGYAVAVSAVSPEEVRETTRYLERWR